MGDSREAAAEISNDTVEVRLSIRISTDEAPSVGRILVGTEDALRGALTALGLMGVDSALDTWHEARAREAQAEGEF